MRDNKLKIFTYILLFFISLACSEMVFCQTDNQKEFRGIWIATINNIDWPSAPGLPVERQKKELREMIDRIEKFKLNAVFFQVRAAADAFYASSTEPWSYFLSGKQGKSTQPFFDPLAYVLELCHSRGIELHAWFNPFRVRNLGYYDLAKNSFAVKYPQYQHDYDNKRFFDPGFPQVRAHLIKVILEVVRKYDIDAVLLDDYFYPYPVRGKSFPDSKTFARYGGKEYYPKHLKDWRRNNINSFIADLHDSIKAVKPSLKLGISPFGVWRSKDEDPNGSPLLRGTTSYDDLYADVYKWMSKDWIDYIIPQLYWEQGNRYGDFNALAKWWNDHSFGKQLYLGQALYRATGSDRRWSNPNEISDQIGLLRKYKNIKGFALFSASHLSRLPEIGLKELVARLDNQEEDSIVKDASSAENVLLTSRENSVSELMPDEKSFDSIIHLNSGKEINRINLSGKLKMRKQHKEWQISWYPPDTINRDRKMFVLLAYQPNQKRASLKKVFVLNSQSKVIFPHDIDFRPRKVLFTVVTVNQINKERLQTKLFKIRRNRVVYKF